MKTAFKEWAVVGEAMAQGKQTVILRKGGIVEDEGRFRPIHPRFLLLPTYVHQAPEGIRPEFLPLLEQVRNQQPVSDQIRISHWAEVATAVQVTSLESLNRLRDEHIWSQAIVEERFRRWQTDSVYALVVKVFPLPDPVLLPMRDSYGGCKSWIELEQDVPTPDTSPVVPSDEFDLRLKSIQAALAQR